MKLLNLTKYVDMIPVPQIKNKVMDIAINLAIPFNRWLGMKIEVLYADRVVVSSPPRTLRKNHVGGAHACALALLGEYPAGLMLSQTFTADQYRMIITKLDVTYHKQGRGHLKSEVLAPQAWPELEKGILIVDLKTEITNAKNESVATVLTTWQLKEWALVRERVRAPKPT
jgi:acyl-coenzyme A thioesterase PaaI-like protein